MDGYWFTRAMEHLEAARFIISSISQVNAPPHPEDAALMKAITDRERSRVELALKDADLQIQQMQNAKNLLLRALESGAQTSRQLAASAMSAVSFADTIGSEKAKGTLYEDLSRKYADRVTKWQEEAATSRLPQANEGPSRLAAMWRRFREWLAWLLEGVALRLR